MCDRNMRYAQERLDYMKRLRLFLLILCAVGIFVGCGKDKDTKITFSPTGITTEVSGVSVDGTTLTIRAAGTYTLTGTCGEGNIIVDAPGGRAVNLILDDLNLTSSKDSPIVIKDCPMVIIEIREKTQNIITDKHQYSELLEQDGQASDTSAFEDVPNAAIYSRSPLMIRGKGEGQLVINADCYNGITSSDTLTIESGVLNITASNHALRGKDYVLISGGVISIKASEDGIKSTNMENASLGYISIKGGVINIQSGDEAMVAPNSVNFTGGTVTIKSKNTGIKTNENGVINFDAGIVTLTANDDPFVGGTPVRKSSALVTINGKEME